MQRCASTLKKKVCNKFILEHTHTVNKKIKHIKIIFEREKKKKKTKACIIKNDITFYFDKKNRE